MMLTLKEIKELTDDEFEKNYDIVARRTVEALSTYSLELHRGENEKGYSRLLNILGIQKEENEKSNKIMKKWTIAIGIMTGVMLLTTIALCGGING